jgi:hypothetical protein
MRYHFDAQGNMVGTDGTGQTDPFYCRNHAKGALDLDNCWRRQHGEKPVNRNDMGKLPKGYTGSLGGGTGLSQTEKNSWCEHSKQAEGNYGSQYCH